MSENGKWRMAKNIGDDYRNLLSLIIIEYHNGWTMAKNKAAAAS